MRDNLKSSDGLSAVVLAAGAMGEDAKAHGRYVFECFGPDGKLKWRDTIENTVMTEGKNLALDTLLAGSGYTVAGPYMGLIADDSFTAIVAGNTAAQINGTNGWTEAGNAQNPTWTGGVRKTMVFSAAAAGVKALSAALTFAITSTGPDTVKGAFVILGSGALSTIDDTNGALLSAGLFTGGDKTVGNGDSITVSWQFTLT